LSKEAGGAFSGVFSWPADFALAKAKRRATMRAVLRAGSAAVRLPGRDRSGTETEEISGEAGLRQYFAMIEGRA
jgi:hypothetical protein